MSSVTKKTTKKKRKNTIKNSTLPPPPVNKIELSEHGRKPVPAERRLTKCRLSHAFQRDECEVADLLENTPQCTELSSHSSADKCNDLFETLSEQFFTEQIERNEVGKLEKQLLSDDEWFRQKVPNIGVEKEVDEVVESEETDENVAKSIMPRHRSVEHENGGSTVIQLEHNLDNDEKYVTSCATSQWQTLRGKDATLLYTPITMSRAELLMQLAKVKSRSKSWNEETIESSLKEIPSFWRATLNRYIYEAQNEKLNLNTSLIESLMQTTTNTSIALNRNNRFRTLCIGGHEFHPVFCAGNSIRDGVEIPTLRIIKIFLKEFRITAHPLFLEEHRLANLLDDEYDNYAQRQQDQTCERLRSQLTIERRVLQQRLQNAATAANDNDQSTTSTHASNEQASILSKQAQLVTDLRTRLYEEEIESRRQLKRLLDSWLELKQLRKRQQFQCTRFKLRVHITPDMLKSKKSFEEMYTLRYETDLKEMCREAWESYYRDKRLWREQRQNLKKKAKKSGASTERPLRPDLKLLASKLRKRLAKCLPDPNEPPNVQLLRVSDEECYTMHPTIGDPISGFTLRKRYFLKIYFDRDFVGLTRTYCMAPDFRVAINEAIGILLDRRLPKEIRIAIYEKTKISTSQKVANLIIPLTGELEVPEEKVSLKIINFTSSKQVGVEGRLYIRIHNEKQSKVSEEGIINMRHDDPQQKNAMRSSVAKLSEGANETDDSIVDTIVNGCSQDTCTFEENLLQFCSNEELKCSRRLNLLKLRYSSEDSNLIQKLQFVPALDHELPDEDILFNNHNSSEDYSPAPTLFDMGNWADPIDLHKHESKKRILAIYETVRTHCRRLRKLQENTQNLLVGDEYDATWSMGFQALAGTFLTLLSYFIKPQLRRPLNPSRNNAGNLIMVPTDSGTLQTVSTRQQLSFNIRLHVVRATGIPIRSRHLLGGGGQSTTDSDVTSQQRENGKYGFEGLLTSGFKYSNIRPFVALSWRDRVCRTTTVDGSNPTWNEHLMLQLSSMDDLRDDIRISLYDEVIIASESIFQRNSPLSSDDATVARIQTNWLGEYRVPLTNLLAQGRTLDGVLELNTPHILIGYRRPAINDGGLLLATANSNTIETAISIGDGYPEIKDSIHLWFYLSCEPQLPNPNSLLTMGNTISCLDCMETKDIREHLSQWTLQVRELRPQRFIQPLVCTAEARRICMTRLLDAIPLPDDVDGSIEAACRFVSLLSIVKLKTIEEMDCQGWEGVWLNNQLLLDTTWASPKDLGVLLCNFLLGIGVNSSLVLGIALPYGETAFVLVEENEGAIFIDPVTGKRHPTKDVFCPLQRIHYIVSKNNIYCNIQRESRVSLTNLNIHDCNNWLAAFSKRKPGPVGGYQNLNYTFTGSYNTTELRKRIERKVMKKITSWRTMRKTIWNRAFQPRLQAILEQLEKSFTDRSYNQITSLSGEIESKYTAQLSAEFPQYKFYGFTWNLPYTNLTAFSELKATGLHMMTDERVEYSVAVHVHSYTQNVFSVWLFLLSITPNNT